MEEEAPKDILTDVISLPDMIRASTVKRFINFVIDYVSFIFLFVGFFFVADLINAEAANLFNQDGIGINVITLLVYGFYMSSIEAITKGRSLGKLITGTKAVNADGTDISVATAFKRGFTRAVPFEVLSAFGNPASPWHDRWNQTCVIDIKRSFILPHDSEL